MMEMLATPFFWKALAAVIGYTVGVIVISVIVARRHE